jgi:hypothetical protein
MANRLLVLLSLFSAFADVYGQAPARFSVVITEIMADPAPVVSLPNAEFVEIKNVSGTAINLQGWRLSTPSATSGQFPNFTLQPDSSLILSSTGNVASFSAFGTAIGIPGFPSLPNDGALLTLTSKDLTTVHAVNYSSGWYDNEVKLEGGWSLEMVDTQNPCGGKNNWKASTDASGGTPGRRNSVTATNSDDVPPQLLRTWSQNSTTIMAVFDEPLDSSSASVASRYSLSNGIHITAAIAQPPLFDQVLLVTDAPLQLQTTYVLNVNGVTDCRGHAVGAYHTASVGLPEPVMSNDLVINEILFDPRPNGYDFVEIYNNSNKIADASKLYIANRNSSGAIASVKKLSESPYLIFPGAYAVITEDARSLQHEYNVKEAGAILSVSSMPSYPNDKGTVVLTDEQGNVVDEVTYSDKWHFALLTNPEGISLERVDPNGNSQDAGNWHSAASTAGFATPTYQNSQLKSTDLGDASFTVTPKVFSPDNDGYDDLATINYQLEQNGYVANVRIFNSTGKLVRYLVKNATLAKKGSWNWDGLDERSQKLPTGTYIIYAEMFNLQGTKQSFKKTVVLARRLQ